MPDTETAWKTIEQMTAEIRQINIDKGWRPAGGGPGNNTFGDYIALLHSEVSEALEAYRDHRLDDATEQLPKCSCAMSEATMVNCGQHGYDAPGDDWNPKPEGVGSELADAVIRLLDMGDVFGIRIRVMPVTDCDASGMESFGDHLAWLHYLIANLLDPEDDGTGADYAASETLQALYVVAHRHGIDLDAEYERKIAYNRTRPFQHGGRTMADDPIGVHGSDGSLAYADDPTPTGVLPDDAVRCPRCPGTVMVVNRLFAEHNRSVHGSADGL